jgi:hypothetical protein
VNLFVLQQPSSADVLQGQAGFQTAPKAPGQQVTSRQDGRTQPNNCEFVCSATAVIEADVLQGQ